MAGPLSSTQKKTVDVVKACVALHNFLTHADAAASPACKYIPPYFPDSTTASGEQVPGEWRRLVYGDNNLLMPGRLSTTRASRAAIAVRNDLRSFFLTSPGSVPWQDTFIRRGCLQ